MTAPHTSSQRGAPAGSTSRPTTRRNRQAPQSPSGTASSRSADTAAAGLPPSRVAEQRERQDVRRGGDAGARARAGARTRRAAATSRRRRPGAGDRPPPATEPNAVAGADQREHDEEGEHERDRVGEEAGHEAGVLGRSSSSSVAARATGPAAARRLGLRARPGAARRRPAPGWWRRRRGRRRSRGRAGRAPTTAPAGGVRRAARPARRSRRALRAARIWPGLGVDATAAAASSSSASPDRADHQEADHPQQGAEERAGPPARAARGRGVGEQRVERGPALLVVGVPAGQRGAPDAAVRGLGVEDDGLRHDEGAVPGAAARQPKSMSLPKIGSWASKPPSSSSTRAAHQHAGGVDREHLADLVVLALVVLAALEPGLAPAGAGDRDADLEQPAQRGPLAQLGAEDRRRRGRSAAAASSAREGVRGRGWRRRAGARPTRGPPAARACSRPSATACGKRRRAGQPERPTRRRPPRAGRRCRPCCRCRPRRPGRRGAVCAAGRR